MDQIGAHGIVTATPVNNCGEDLYELLCFADTDLEPGIGETPADRASRARMRTEHAAELHRPHPAGRPLTKGQP